MTTPYDDVRGFVDIDGVSLHYDLSGEPDKPALALVNMASHNLTCWELILDQLLTFAQVLRFDIRGTGRSGWGDKDSFTFTRYADDLVGIMDHCGLEDAAVVGVAYGARTAVRFADRHLDRLSMLGLFDVSLRPPVDQKDQGRLGEEALDLLKAAGEPVVERQKYWRFYENRDAAALAHTAHQHEEDLSERMGHLKVPVLVACGRQDMNLDEAERIAQHIPRAELRVMEMTGHGSLFYRPTLVADLLRELMQESEI